MKTIIFILIQFLIIGAQAQSRISGQIVTRSGEPVVGANVYLRGTYDGGTTDSLGYFRFTTSGSGIQTLMVSFIGFETQSISLDLETGNTSPIKILLKESLSELNAVVINAGTFDASDKKKSVMLRPMDIALTAGANGDVYGAFGTLPGSHRVGEEGRLFVRGGESYETKTFMDGMLIQTPYFSKMPDLPTRGRYSPLLFNGAVFSTGGYSAEFGQALSSVVALNTTALEPETKSGISLLTVGAQGSHAQRWENTSLALTGELLHTALSNKIFRPDIHWIDDPVIAGSTMMFRHKTSNTGMIKSFGSFSYDACRMLHPNFQESVVQDIALNNSNSYLNTTYIEELNSNWVFQAGFAANMDVDHIFLDQHTIKTTQKSGQAKISFINESIKNVETKMGADYQYFEFQEDVKMNGHFQLPFTNHLASAFVESEARLSPSIALRAGIRSEYNSLTQKSYFSPRLSAAFKTGKFSQLSAAYGTFVQNPENRYLKFTTDLHPEKSEHTIITWQYKKETQTLRIEAYHKNYTELVKFREEYSTAPGNYTNSGSGYSRGIDVFWRNQKEFGKSDYWISYSWNDTQRNYRDYPVMATPYYASSHNVSAVYKRFIPGINSFLSATYSFATGRPYYNPNNPEFMADRTRSFNDISFGFTHIFTLFNTQTVLHLVANNVFGFDNIYGYNFSRVPDSQGIYPSQPIASPQKRMAILLISFQL
jgi:membrane-bound inhibitor of C-type lysozyme